jgi:hypothetical protein
MIDQADLNEQTPSIVGELFVTGDYNSDTRHEPRFTLAHYWQNIIGQAFIPYEMEQRRLHLPHAFLARASPKRGNGLLVVNRWVARGLSFLWPARL